MEKQSKAEKYFSSVNNLLKIIMLITLLLFFVLPLLLPQGSGSATNLLDPSAVAPVFSASKGLFGYIKITNSAGFSLAYANLLINGEIVADFSSSEVTVRVYADDIIEIDSSAYQKELFFEVEILSSSINPSSLSSNFSSNGELTKVGIIVFY